MTNLWGKKGKRKTTSELSQANVTSRHYTSPDRAVKESWWKAEGKRGSNHRLYDRRVQPTDRRREQLARTHFQMTGCFVSWISRAVIAGLPAHQWNDSVRTEDKLHRTSGQKDR